MQVSHYEILLPLRPKKPFLLTAPEWPRSLAAQFSVSSRFYSSAPCTLVGQSCNLPMAHKINRISHLTPRMIANSTLLFNPQVSVCRRWAYLGHILKISPLLYISEVSSSAQKHRHSMTFNYHGNIAKVSENRILRSARNPVFVAALYVAHFATWAGWRTE